MRKLVIVLLFVCGIGGIVKAQSTSTPQAIDIYRNLNLSAKDTVMFQFMEAYLSQLREPRFQLFKTQNMWNFLKLDTMTGQIWQVQFSVSEKGYRTEVPLDLTMRVSEEYDEMICGRFTLYATDNMYNFIMLDKIDGRCWQVQWNIEPENRGVLRIY